MPQSETSDIIIFYWHRPHFPVMKKFKELLPSLKFYLNYLLLVTISSPRNLVNRLHLDYGRRIRSAYLIFGIAIDYFLFEEEDQDVYKINSTRIATGKMMKWNSELWPGYRVGVQF